MGRRLAGHPHPRAGRQARARRAARRAPSIIPLPAVAAQSMINQMLERQAIARYTGMIR